MKRFRSEGHYLLVSKHDANVLALKEEFIQKAVRCYCSEEKNMAAFSTARTSSAAKKSS
jgi:hypothetical protein